MGSMPSGFCPLLSFALPAKLNLAFSFFTASLGLFVRLFLSLKSFRCLPDFPGLRFAHALRLYATLPCSFGIFQGCITVYLSRFCVLFQQISYHLCCNSFDILSYHSCRVKHFFYFFTFFLHKISSHRLSGGILI